MINDNIGVKVPEILLPKTKEMTEWAVIACDQFTQEQEYWKEVEQLASGKPSAFNLIYPEVYLNEDNEKYINKINHNMKDYIDNGVFKNLGEGFILVVRQTPYAKRRLGLMLSVDLDKYSFEKGSAPLIRATEGTIIERLPPRMKIRENAPLELPHIMLLIDDKNKTVIEPLFEIKDSFEKVYDFELNMNGGKIQGYFIKDTESICNNLEKLLDKNKYGEGTEFLFAVGDGNHSLATAKMCWEKLKPSLSEKERENHPARYALCEVVNLYDDGLSFEPIHRLCFVDNVDDFIKRFNFKGNLKASLVVNNQEIEIAINDDLAKAIREIDDLIKESNAKVDYVHGENAVKCVCHKNAKAVGILLPKMDKNDLFKSVAKNGALPRKTFSMGEAVEKRYYIEAKRIKF